MRPVPDGLTLAQHDSSHATVKLGRMSVLLGSGKKLAKQEEKVVLCSVCEKIDLKPILFSEDHPEDHRDCWEGDELKDFEKDYELGNR